MYWFNVSINIDRLFVLHYCTFSKATPLPQFQTGFILGLVKPLYDVFAKISVLDLSEPLECIETNLKRWQTGGESSSDEAKPKKRSVSGDAALDTVDELADAVLVDDVDVDLDED